MLIKQVVYFLCIFIFIISIITIIYAKSNKKKNVCKNIIVLSIIYVIFLILDIDVLPLLLNLDIGFEMLIYRTLLFIAIILFVFSIVISNKKLKKLEFIENSRKDKTILFLLIMFPVIIFSFSYFREIYYINNSELILVCASGENFGKEYFAYAINDNYCKKISIGTDFKGYDMVRYLPKDFKELNYSWARNEVEIDGNKIVVYGNNKIIYESKLNCKISNYDFEEIFYK